MHFISLQLLQSTAVTCYLHYIWGLTKSSYSVASHYPTGSGFASIYKANNERSLNVNLHPTQKADSHDGTAGNHFYMSVKMQIDNALSVSGKNADVKTTLSSFFSN